MSFSLAIANSGSNANAYGLHSSKQPQANYYFTN